ncbi:MAG: inositol monophosphatase family protein [Fidelibacterota bacterium]
MPKTISALAKDTQTFLDVARSAALGAADIIMAALDRPRTYSQKRVTDLVTDTDRRSEDFILSRLSTEFSDHGILAEESGATSNTSDYLWVIDPLDGTTNFVHGYPSFAVSIGLLEKGNPILGVVVELPVGQVYTGIKGHGAFRDGKPISVSRTSSLQHALLVTGFGYEHGAVWEKNMALFKMFTDRTQGVRRLGAAAVDLCHVACGQVDGFWEFDLAPWDTAAGIVIVSEAGGVITQLNGDDYTIHSGSILATNGLLQAEMMEEMRKL